MKASPVEPARVAIVFGTYNRKRLLERAIASVRAAVGDHPYVIIIVDGGSTDGTREYLAEQPDVAALHQEGPLTGAVGAFNLGFALAVEAGYDYVAHLNDDAEIVTPLAIERAIAILDADEKIGEVAFEFDLRGPWGFETVNGAVYANYGVIRCEAGMAVARMQGDPTGRAWWNPIYRTYGADTELGVWLWKLGWKVYPAIGLRVHDANAQDELRATNLADDPDRPDSRLFWSRWRNEKLPVTKIPPAKIPTRFAAAVRSMSGPPRNRRVGKPLRRPR